MAPLLDMALFKGSSYRMFVVIADNEEPKYPFEHYIGRKKAMLIVAYG
jgi:hypothetical protein